MSRTRTPFNVGPCECCGGGCDLTYNLSIVVDWPTIDVEADNGPPNHIYPPPSEFDADNYQLYAAVTTGAGTILVNRLNSNNRSGGLSSGTCLNFSSWPQVRGYRYIDHATGLPFSTTHTLPPRVMDSFGSVEDVLPTPPLVCSGPRTFRCWYTNSTSTGFGTDVAPTTASATLTNVGPDNLRVNGTLVTVGNTYVLAVPYTGREDAGAGADDYLTEAVAELVVTCA